MQAGAAWQKERPIRSNIETRSTKVAAPESGLTARFGVTPREARGPGDSYTRRRITTHPTGSARQMPECCEPVFCCCEPDVDACEPAGSSL